MALDGITCELLARELNDMLEGRRIDKIFMPDRFTLILHIRTREGISKLLISINPGSQRAGFTETTRSNPQMPPSFCMLLRKHLSGSRITSVTNPGYERIIEFHCSNTDELKDNKEFTLTAELMGRFSNLILINGSGKILDSAIHVDYQVSRVREIMPARIYEYPPLQDKITPDDALEMLNKDRICILEDEKARPIEKALVNSIKGMSPLLARQLCHKAGIDERIPCHDLGEAEIESLNKECRLFFEDVINNTYTPRVFYGPEGEPCEFAPMALVGYEKTREVRNLSEALDIFYKAKESGIDLEARRHRLMQIVNSAISRLIKKRDVHDKDLAEGAMAGKYKLYGDLILTYKYMVKPQAAELVCTNYEKDPPEDITIPLDPSMGASDNSQEYYKRFRKAKRKAELAEEYIREDDLGLAYLRSLKTAIESASCEEDLEALEEEIKEESSQIKKAKPVQNTGDPNKQVGIAKSGKASSRALREAAKRAQDRNKKISSKKKEVSFRKRITSDGYEILSGRNNIQNDKLTFQIASKQDWWFHIKGLPGTHVILKVRPGEDMPSDNAVIEAAELAAFYSKSTILEEHLEGKGSKPGFIKAEVDYCPVSHVKKIPGAKPGMVIYKEYYSIVVDCKDPS